ncbi:hypothetical protein Slin15195_G117580 [Septoria linicola]|uniref:YCII-related domain-containing protein n=1 Tax=Septoria linicola TaxID=215465 RepID=A0A9Q9EQ63_9PEZI|nr:hypothetical protein Slin14017_G094600 [Septoria linicola]USW58439.1 hypothetical protein Slin15195_G117580 [Septoria linicola]
MGKQEWMVILPDKPDALASRMEIRPQHLAAIKPHISSGLLVLGGASLDEPLQEGQPPKINGSVLMAEADTKEEVMELVKSDVYYTKGVWDVEKIQIFPFKSAVREALK